MVWILLKYMSKILFSFILTAVSTFPFAVFCVFRFVTSIGRLCASRWETEVKNYRECPISREFEKLLKEITPTKQLTKEVQRTAKHIVKYLKKHGANQGLAIKKYLIAGSFAKNCAITLKSIDGKVFKSDLDLVVYLKNSDLLLGRQLNDKVKKILEEIPRVSNIHVKKRSIRFYVTTPTQGEIKVDLIVTKTQIRNVSNHLDISLKQANIASNLLWGKQSKAIQKSGCIDKLENRLHSYAFSRLSVQVIRSYTCDPFILKVIRLAKYWTRKMNIPRGNRAPRSCMLEVMVITALTQMRGGNKCVVSGFIRFLESVAALRTLNVSIHSNSNGMSDWNWSVPRVVDPVNNFNNFADGLDDEVMEILMDQAYKTLKKIEEFKSSAVENAIDVNEIFSFKRSTRGDQHNTLDFFTQKLLMKSCC